MSIRHAKDEVPTSLPAARRYLDDIQPIGSILSGFSTPDRHGHIHIQYKVGDMGCDSISDLADAARMAITLSSRHSLSGLKQHRFSMPRHRPLSLEAIRQALNTECPHCHAILGPAEWQRIDGERLRCLKCQKEFVPKGPEKPIQTS